MNQTIDDEFNDLLVRLAAAFDAVGKQVAKATRSRERSHGQLADEVGSKENRISRELDAIERDAVNVVKRSVDGSEGLQSAITVLQMSANLRRIDRLAVELSTSAGAPITAELPEDLTERMHRMAELALFQLSAAQEALVSRNRTQAETALTQDVELDGWYDLLLQESFDDVAESGVVPAQLAELLRYAKVLERISGYAIALSQEVVRVVRA